jgi:hypothetical protein
MALKKTFENQEGGTSNGYYRAREVGTYYEKDKDETMSLAASFVVELFDYDTGKRVDNVRVQKEGQPSTIWKPEGIGVYGLTLPDLEPVQNLIIKAYEHLKTLPEFNGATDC